MSFLSLSYFAWVTPTSSRFCSGLPSPERAFPSPNLIPSLQLEYRFNHRFPQHPLHTAFVTLSSNYLSLQTVRFSRAEIVPEISPGSGPGTQHMLTKCWIDKLSPAWFLHQTPSVSLLQPNTLKFPHHCGPLVTRSPRRAWILIDTSPLEKQLSIHALFLVGQECHLSSMNVRGRTGGPWSQRNKIQVPVAPFSCATLAKPTMPYEIHFPHL